MADRPGAAGARLFDSTRHGRHPAAISLARELGADWVLIDERKETREAREARDRGLQVAGTLVVIEEAAAQDLLDYGKTKDRLVNHTNFYVTEDVIRESEQRYRQRKLVQEQQSSQVEES